MAKAKQTEIRLADLEQLYSKLHSGDVVLSPESDTQRAAIVVQIKAIAEGRPASGFDYLAVGLITNSIGKTELNIRPLSSLLINSADDHYVLRLAPSVRRTADIEAIHEHIFDTEHNGRQIPGRVIELARRNQSWLGKLIGRQHAPITETTFPTTADLDFVTSALALAGVTETNVRVSSAYQLASLTLWAPEYFTIDHDDQLPSAFNTIFVSRPVHIEDVPTAVATGVTGATGVTAATGVAEAEAA
jgi:hypothetical protein